MIFRFVFLARWRAVRTKLIPSGMPASLVWYICECIASVSTKTSHLRFEIAGIADLRKSTMVKRKGGNADSLTLSTIP